MTHFCPVFDASLPVQVLVKTNASCHSHVARIHSFLGVIFTIEFRMVSQKWRVATRREQKKMNKEKKMRVQVLGEQQSNTPFGSSRAFCPTPELLVALDACPKV
jgi:hypothetical protein